MNKRKAIGISLLLLAVGIGISGFAVYVYGIYNNFDWAQILGFASNLLSPTTIVGIVIKFFMNKKQLKQIDKVVNEKKETKEMIEKKKGLFRKFKIGNFDVDITKKSIVIEFDVESFNNENDFYEQLKCCSNEMLEKVRKIIAGEL